MVYMKIRALTTITVADHRSLVKAWSTWNERERALIGRFIVEKPLTDAQFRRLPAALKRIVEGPGVCAAL